MTSDLRCRNVQTQEITISTFLQVLNDLVRYAIWLLECSHDSGQCHAALFFNISFQFHVILKLFDQRVGLPRLLTKCAFTNTRQSFFARGCFVDFTPIPRDPAAFACIIIVLQRFGYW